jgi:hypothetical protein
MLRRLHLGVIIIVILFSAILPGAAVSASSIYDDSYNTTLNIQAGGNGCSPLDITATYSSYILDSSKWFLSASTMQPIKDSYEDALTNGRIGVSMRKNYGSQQSSTVVREVFVYWNTDDSLPLQWSGSSSKSVYALVGNYVSITCLGNYQGGAGKIGVATIFIADETETIRAAPVSNDLPDTFSPYAAIDRNLFVNSNMPNYPTGYEGGGIQSGSVIIPVTGNVQCANTNNVISAVQVNAQSGMDGNATITDDGNGGKNYRYYLSEESPYSLIVLCDGDPFYGPTVNSNLYSPYNWVCTHANDLDVCAAS